MNDLPSRVTVMVPTPIAEQLRVQGSAFPASKRRGPIPELVIDAAGVAATVISLLQGPQTTRELARLLYTWTRDHHDDKGAETHLVASGPGGRLELTVTGRTDIAELESLLQNTIFAEDSDA